MANYFDQFDPAAAPAPPPPPPGGFSAPGVRVTIQPPPAAAPAAAAPASGANYFDQFDETEEAQTEAAIAADAMPQSQALAKGIEQGASLNFADEIKAAGDASGLPEVNGPFSVLARPAVGWLRSLVSDEGAKAYDESMAKSQAQIEAAQQQHPGTFAGGQIGGAILTAPVMPAANLVKGVGIGARTANAAITGAGYGGAAGAGQGRTWLERLQQGTLGAGLGAGIGAVATPAIEGAAALGRAVVEPVRRGYRAWTNAEGEAGRRVGEAFGRDGVDLEKAAIALENAQQSGVPLIVADTGGETVRQTARAAKNTSTEAAEALQGRVQDRFHTQTDRADALMRRITGAGGDTAGELDALKSAARVANRPAYDRAYARGQGVWTPELEQLMQAPAMQDAVRVALKTGNNRMAAEGFAPIKEVFEEVNGRLMLKTNPDGSRAVPNLQFWDQVHRELADAAQAGKQTGKGNAAGDVALLDRKLLSHLDDMVPEFREARAGAARAFGAQDALEAGQAFVSSRMENAAARRAFSALSDPEKALFQQGFANDLIDKISKQGDSRDLANAVFLNNPKARERIRIVLGDEGARELEAFVRIENIMNKTRGAVMGNSSTVAQLAAHGATGMGAYGLISGDRDPRNIGVAGLAAMALKGGRMKLDQRVAQRMGEMLASENPDIIRQAIKMVARSGPLMDAVRRGEVEIGRILAPANTPRIAVEGSAAADEGQQQQR